MAALGMVLFYIFAILVISTSSEANNTATPNTLDPKEFKPSGALASFGRMVVDLPLGLVESFKDAAETIESVILGIVRTIFT